jgi:hypothetical protein
MASTDGMGMIDMTDDEMRVMNEETIGDHNGKSPQRTKRLSDRENWLLCKKTHRAWIGTARNDWQPWKSKSERSARLKTGLGQNRPNMAIKGISSTVYIERQGIWGSPIALVVGGKACRGKMNS